ncbi:hypothetical protein NKR23_g12099 [Pleurostoma richardsiae]|uniref:Uncharacterized protein n=1 Tax=Pleurostoma richardsiae TaxID=41990 RepID=A0AA38R2Q1_9PEZI|nr:hypothetical protein NKR23_g12099 [Pleurostoma richardsiae]
MTRNNPSSPFQRKTVTQSCGDVLVHCMSTCVVHGHLSSEQPGTPGKRATALVFTFQVDVAKVHRRIRRASFTFKFRSAAPNRPGPTVRSMAPQGRAVLQPTSQDVSVTRSCDAKAEAGPAGLALGGSLKWEKVVQETAKDEARLIGSPFCDEFGDQIGASWVLQENASARTGVPSRLQTAVLLERPDDGDFLCDFTMDLEADWRMDMRHLFTRVPKDDPVLFRPSLPPTHPLEMEWISRHLDQLCSAAFCSYQSGAAVADVLPPLARPLSLPQLESPVD